ncbi:MAG: cytochrome c-type biogenesis protein CcmH [Proteobacteria bacterium]|nr:cytochrome c-type biogenesis protein CcmH [Pseudomonadota bacterium]
MSHQQPLLLNLLKIIALFGGYGFWCLGFQPSAMADEGISESQSYRQAYELWLTQDHVTAEQKELFFSVAANLRCPTCTGLSVLQSDAPFSIQIKNLVQEQVSQGANQREIITFFTERYGLWILREPPKKGEHLLIWLLPVLFLLFGVFWLISLLKSPTNKEATNTTKIGWQPTLEQEIKNRELK